MNKELRLIQHLYGEDDRPEEIEQILAADDTLRDVYRRWRAVKKQLDAKPPQRPDAAVIDRVVESAGSRSEERASQRSARKRTDRAPSTRRRTPWQRVLRVTAALAVLLIGVSIGVWQWEAEESLVANSDPTAATAQDDAARMSAADERSMPEWDEADDVVRLHRYIETLQARSSTTSWDYPGEGLQPASRVRSSNN
jgi:anti-sigma-K factor RskA